MARGRGNQWYGSRRLSDRAKKAAQTRKQRKARRSAAGQGGRSGSACLVLILGTVAFGALAERTRRLRSR